LLGGIAGVFTLYGYVQVAAITATFAMLVKGLFGNYLRSKESGTQTIVPAPIVVAAPPTTTQ
jgi:hypothetical protein